MSGNLDDILRDAARLGWVFTGYGGNSHLHLVHLGTGARYVIASTSSDQRSRRAALAGLERLAGRRLPRPRAGRYRNRGQQPLLDFRRSTAEVIAGAAVDELIGEARTLRAHFDQLPVDDVEGARRVADRYDAIRDRLAKRYWRVIPPITSLDRP